MARNLLPSSGMNTTQTIILAGLTSAIPTVALATTVTIADDADDALAIADVSRRGNAVVGTLINQTADALRDVRVLVDIAFLWTNEESPGEDSPGRSVVMTIPGPIEPHGKIAFDLTPNPPLPERTDGRYADPKVTVLGYLHAVAR